MGFEEIKNIFPEDKEELLNNINNSLEDNKESLNSRLEKNPEYMTFNEIKELLDDIKEEVRKMNEKSNDVKGLDPRITELFEKQRRFVAKYQELKRAA